MALPLSAIPKPVAHFSTSLASKIESSDTSLTLETATDDATNAISGVVGLTIDGEDMIGTKSGTSVTGLLRGIDPQDGTSEVSALKAAHQRGAVVKITTSPFLLIAYRLLNGTEGFPNKLKYPSSQTPTIGQYHIVDWDYIKAYADALAIAGAPDADETTPGLVEEATTAEVTAGTAAGASARLFAPPSKLAAQIQSGTWITLTETASGDDAYTATTTPTVVPAAGMFFFGSFATANTTGATLSVNSETPVAIQKVVSGALGALETGDIIANVPNLYYRTASVYVLLSPLGSMPSTAIMSEMATFFGSFAGTAAQVTAVTDDSVLTDKHFHKKTYGVLSSSGSTENIAHGLGVTPKRVRIIGYTNGTTNTAGYAQVSIAEFDGTTYAGIYDNMTTNASNVPATQTSYLFRFYDGNTDHYATAALDATNIALTWTSGSSYYKLFWEAEV